MPTESGFKLVRLDMEQGSTPEQWRAAVRLAWFSQHTRDNETVNFATWESGRDDDDDSNARFLRCWRRQDCRSCLGISACSWCPYSAACVPNDHLIPALAPAIEGDLVCPYWAERWELRTRPLGCQVSTITSLTALVAVFGTLAAALLGWAIVKRVRLRRRRVWAIPPEHWLIRRPDQPDDSSDSERAPLLNAG